jgi:hypothetical protein
MWTGSTARHSLIGSFLCTCELLPHRGCFTAGPLTLGSAFRSPPVGPGPGRRQAVRGQRTSADAANR